MIWSCSRDRTFSKCPRQDFYRSALANSRRTRFPIGPKLNDRRLFEDTGEYDAQQIELREQEVEP
jgi:hypothetical protein